MDKFINGYFPYSKDYTIEHKLKIMTKLIKKNDLTLEPKDIIYVYDKLNEQWRRDMLVVILNHDKNIFIAVILAFNDNNLNDNDFVIFYYLIYGAGISKKHEQLIY